jgi:hypothetical protein
MRETDDKLKPEAAAMVFNKLLLPYYEMIFDFMSHS